MAYDTLTKKRRYSKWYYRTHKVEHTKRVRRWREKNRRKWRKYGRDRARRCAARLKEIKLAAGCCTCGYRLCAGALEFDHVRGRKKFDICHAPTRSWKSVVKEMAKCEIVCANCHAERTERRRFTKGKT